MSENILLPAAAPSPFLCASLFFASFHVFLSSYWHDSWERVSLSPDWFVLIDSTERYWFFRLSSKTGNRDLNISSERSNNDFVLLCLRLALSLEFCQLVFLHSSLEKYRCKFSLFSMFPISTLPFFFIFFVFSVFSIFPSNFYMSEISQCYASVFKYILNTLRFVIHIPIKVGRN